MNENSQVSKEKLHSESCPKHGLMVVGLGCPYCIRDERDKYKQIAELNAETIRTMQEHKAYAFGTLGEISL